MKIDNNTIKEAFERAVEARVFVYIQNNFGQNALDDYLSVLENRFDADALANFEHEWSLDMISIYKDVEQQVLAEAQSRLNKVNA